MLDLRRQKVAITAGAVFLFQRADNSAVFDSAVTTEISDPFAGFIAFPAKLIPFSYMITSCPLARLSDQQETANLYIHINEISLLFVPVIVYNPSGARLSLFASIYVCTTVRAGKKEKKKLFKSPVKSNYTVCRYSLLVPLTL